LWLGSWLGFSGWFGGGRLGIWLGSWFGSSFGDRVTGLRILLVFTFKKYVKSKPEIEIVVEHIRVGVSTKGNSSTKK